MEEATSPLVKHLEELREKEDTGALARLRRGLGKKLGTPQMYSHVILYVGDGIAELERGVLVAALFALHPNRAPRGRSMGEAFRLMRDGSNEASLERRFTALLSASGQDIGGHLRHAVSLAKSKGVTLDYDRLLKDLRAWNHEDRYVQLRWAKDFWDRSAGKENSNVLPEDSRKGE